MIKHVYLFKLKQGIDPHAVVAKIMTLKDAVPEISRLDAGVNFRSASNAYDVVEICEFDTQEKFDCFTNNEYHNEVRKFLTSVQEASVKADIFC